VIKILLAPLLLTLSLNALELKELDNATLELTHKEAVEFCKTEKGWRLPTAKELFTLFTDHAYAIKNQDRNYWSSTLYKGSKDRAWQVLHPDRDTSPMPKSNKLLALCVKDTVPKEYDDHRFTVQKDKLIDDKHQKIFWQPLSRKEGRQKFTFGDAREHCQSLKLANHTWRLPTLNEFFNIVDFTRTKPALDKKIFKYTKFKYYWSGDFIEDYNNEAYVVGLKIGTVATNTRMGESFVRCVSDY
jgi:hypothetical protein